MTPANLDIKAFPEDVKILKSMLAVQFSNQEKQKNEIENYRSSLHVFEEKIVLHQEEIKTREEKIQFLDQENVLLREQVRLLKMKRFASSSEKLSSDQNELFNEAELLSKDEIAPEELAALCPSELPSAVVVQNKQKPKPKRKALPANLVREEVILDLPEAEKICSQEDCRSILKEIAPEVSEQLDYVPAQLKVICTIRKKYVCPCCDETIKSAVLPEKILPKSNAAAGLLAYIAVSKYVDALPLYRLSGMFDRMEVDLPRNTMAGWMIAVSEKLIPIYNLMEEELLSSDYICCDETRTQVLHEEGKDAQSLSYMWVRARPGESPIVLFDYSPTRSGEVPKRLLKDFKGYLQVDGYAGYDGVCVLNNLIRVGCMSHMRRNFFDAFKVNKNEASGSAYVLNQIKGLYKIEEEIEDKKPEEKKRVRQAKALPVLSAVKQWLEENEAKYAPQSLMGKALTYARNQWKTLLVYTTNGKLNIDNNFTENRIRPFAVGRKNWLFSDTVAGAEASARLYSILQTARANGLEPYAYLKHLLTELPKAKTLEEIEKLLPYKIDPKILN